MMYVNASQNKKQIVKLPATHTYTHNQHTMKHELHDSIDRFTTSANSKQLHNVLVIKPLHHLCLAQEVQL